MAAPVPVHAEAVPQRPDLVRWAVPAGLLCFVGVPERVPPALARLMPSVIASVEVVPAGVLLALADGPTWAEQGDGVRVALQEALADVEGWAPPAGVGEEQAADDLLAASARQVLAGEVGGYARSHGGSLDLVLAHDGRVEVALRGTCHGCPAAGHTHEQRVLTALRALVPDVREVVSAGPAAPDTPSAARGRRLLPLRVRRG